MKKPLVLLAALSFLIFGGACMTAKLKSSHPIEEIHASIEEVSSFLITKDDKQLIVIGKEYHYIFTANDETLKFILRWPENNRVKATFSSFNIKNDQSLSGSYTFKVDNRNGLTPELSRLLISKGFTKTNNEIFIYQAKLKGTRYLAGDFKVPSTMQLKQKYSITMVESSNGKTENNSGNVLKINDGPAFI